jgi:multiple sugar transport system ATP-binding protein
LGLRPESVRVVPESEATTSAKVELVERLGERTLVYATLDGGHPFTAEDKGTSPVRIGDRVGLRVDGAAAHLFGADGAGHHAEAAAA